jgi:hypothetical protein
MNPTKEVADRNDGDYADGDSYPADGTSCLTGNNYACRIPDGTHPSTYGIKDSKHIVEDKTKQPGE